MPRVQDTPARVPGAGTGVPHRASFACCAIAGLAVAQANVHPHRAAAAGGVLLCAAAATRPRALQGIHQGAAPRARAARQQAGRRDARVRLPPPLHSAPLHATRRLRARVRARFPACRPACRPAGLTAKSDTVCHTRCRSCCHLPSLMRAVAHSRARCRRCCSTRFQGQLISSAVELLLQSFGVLAYSIAFPELCFPSAPSPTR